MTQVRFFWLVVAIGFAVVSAAVASVAHAHAPLTSTQGTSVCGTIAADTVWPASGSPYTATCNVTVAGGATLTIKPGVTVRLGGAAAGQQLVVASGGSLVAEGTAQQPVVFTSGAATPNAGDWSNVVVSDGGAASLAHCEVAYAGRFGFFAALQVNGSAVTVRHCWLHHNLGDAVQIFGSNLAPVIEDTRFEQNALAAINQSTPDASPTYRHLAATGNGTDAVVINGGFVQGVRAWNLADAGIPIFVNGTVNVAGGGVLQVEAGSVVRFDGSLARLGVSGRLYALGTAARPVVLTGRTVTPGSWAGVAIAAGGRAVFENCEVAYAAGLAVGSSQTVIHACDIHDSSVVGIQVENNAQPVIAGNSIRSNPRGLVNTSNSAEVDARGNWWGDPTGPHHQLLNPAGLGNDVSDLVRFADWLEAPPVAPPPVSDLSIDVSGPHTVNPGGLAEFVVSYQYVGTTPLENAVMVVVLPAVAEFESSSADGIYWAGRRELFWKLGTLAPPVAAGEQVIRVRYRWGLPEAAYPILVQIGASNWPDGALDVAPYLDYAPVTRTGATALAQHQVTALLQSHAGLRVLYQGALDRDFKFIGGFDTTISDGRTAPVLILVKPPTAAIFLHVEDGRIYAVSVDPELGVVEQVNGGMRVSLEDGVIEPFGAWTPGSATGNLRELLQPQGAYGQCVRNCLNEEFGFTYWLSNLFGGVDTVLSTVQCLSCAETGNCGDCALDLLNKEGLGELNSAYKCFSQCSDRPDQFRCNEGDVIRTCRSPSNWDWLTGDNSRCGHLEYTCNGDSGQWNTTPNHVTFWGANYSCVERQGCVDCPAGECYDEVAPTTGAIQVWSPAGLDVTTALQCVIAETAAGAGSSRTCDSQCPWVRTGRDPNAKFGPTGDLLPGQLVTYTIAYENVGAGRAYGVFVVDRLSEQFDDSTLTFSGNGLYIPQSRTILWDIGELAPSGEPGAKGEVTVALRLRGDTPSGALVVNQAVVHFPSVPEITPTNPVINEVRTVAALPQTIRTRANQPAGILLQGQAAGSPALTFAVAAQPQNGRLTGTPPNLTYTPAQDFNGQDLFTYRASHGASHSKPAEITLIVRPDGSDGAPPQVRWVSPQAGAVVTALPQTPLVDLGDQQLYAPVIRIGFSEALDAGTVNAGAVRLVRDGGTQVGLYVTFVGLDNSVRAYPTQPLEGNTGYTVTVDKSLTDVIGNRLAAPVTWRFQIGQVAAQQLYLPEVRR